MVGGYKGGDSVGEVAKRRGRRRRESRRGMSFKHLNP